MTGMRTLRAQAAFMKGLLERLSAARITSRAPEAGFQWLRRASGRMFRSDREIRSFFFSERHTVRREIVADAGSGSGSRIMLQMVLPFRERMPGDSGRESVRKSVQSGPQSSIPGSGRSRKGSAFISRFPIIAGIPAPSIFSPPRVGPAGDKRMFRLSRSYAAGPAVGGNGERGNTVLRSAAGARSSQLGTGTLPEKRMNKLPEAAMRRDAGRDNAARHPVEEHRFAKALPIGLKVPPPFTGESIPAFRRSMTPIFSPRKPHEFPAVESGLRIFPETILRNSSARGIFRPSADRTLVPVRRFVSRKPISGSAGYEAVFPAGLPIQRRNGPQRLDIQAMALAIAPSPRRGHPDPDSKRNREESERLIVERVESRIEEKVERIISREFSPDSEHARRMGDGIFNRLYEGLVLEKERMGGY